MKYNLGDKVKCNGFLKKTGYYILIEKDKYNQAVYTNDPQYSVDKDKYNQFDEGSLVEIKKYEQKEFIGFVCGKRCVATTIYYDTSEYGGVHICKQDFTDCYEVCVENKNKSWGKRLVPKEELELI